MIVTFEKETYAIDDFLQDHPGGVPILKKYVGKDITKPFNMIGHSPKAH